MHGWQAAMCAISDGRHYSRVSDDTQRKRLACLGTVANFPQTDVITRLDDRRAEARRLGRLASRINEQLLEVAILIAAKRMHRLPSMAGGAWGSHDPPGFFSQ